MPTKEQTIPKGYKHTEVGVIPSDWEAKNMEGLVKITSGESPSRFQMVHDGTPYFKVEQLNIGTKYQKETPYYIKGGTIVSKKSLIFPKRGASILLNKIKILSADSFMDTNLMTLTASEEIDNEYLYYALLNFGLWRVADTTTIPQINNKHINPLELAFPKTKSEQTAIATALSDIDALIEKLTKLIEKKKNIKQGAMQELLTGKRRLPGFSGKWETKKLGEVAEFVKGRGLSKSKLNDEGDYPCILYGELFTTYSRVIKKVKSRTNHNEGLSSVTGDILLPGSTTTVGIDLAIASALLKNDVLLGGDVIVIRKNAQKYYDPEFLANYLTHVSKYEISGITQGITIIHLHASRLKEILIKIPNDVTEQTTIGTILSDMDTEIERLESQLSKYQNLKQGMMQTLLTGKIRLI